VEGYADVGRGRGGTREDGGACDLAVSLTFPFVLMECERGEIWPKWHREGVVHLEKEQRRAPAGGNRVPMMVEACFIMEMETEMEMGMEMEMDVSKGKGWVEMIAVTQPGRFGRSSRCALGDVRSAKWIAKGRSRLST
jgi:hypothetical protein